MDTVSQLTCTSYIDASHLFDYVYATTIKLSLISQF